MKDIKTSEIQIFINRYIEKENYRAAKKLYILLNAFFQYALNDGIIQRNPAANVVTPRYEQKNGTALSMQEEQLLVKNLSMSDNPVKYYYLLALYTGARRSEIETIKFDLEKGWLTIQSAKIRKYQGIKYRSLPIPPLLLPYLPITLSKKISGDYLSRHLNDFIPGHHLHDLRHTFITRAKECGCNPEIISLWVGHSRSGNMTDDVYTHYSQEDHEKEMKKLIY